MKVTLAIVRLDDKFTSRIVKVGVLLFEENPRFFIYSLYVYIQATLTMCFCFSKEFMS